MAHEFFQHAGEFAAERLALEKLPFIEGRTIAQREPGHEIIAVEGSSFGQRCDAAGARFRRQVMVRLTIRHAFPKLVDIDGEFGMWCQPDGFPIDLQLFAG